MTETSVRAADGGSTELQRNYVKAMASAPFANPTEWCRMAGYSDKSQGGEGYGVSDAA